MRAYNLFRHRDKQHLLCAVPEDCEVPRFIAERAWSFGGKVTEAAAAPVGFDVLAARHGVQLNGFYPSRISAGAEQQGAAGTISVAETPATAKEHFQSRPTLSKAWAAGSPPRSLRPGR